MERPLHSRRNEMVVGAAMFALDTLNAKREGCIVCAELCDKPYVRPPVVLLALGIDKVQDGLCYFGLVKESILEQLLEYVDQTGEKSAAPRDVAHSSVPHLGEYVVQRDRVSSLDVRCQRL